MILRLSITVLKIFVKKCFLKKYAEGYKSEVATKAFFLMKCLPDFPPRL